MQAKDIPDEIFLDVVRKFNNGEEVHDACGYHDTVPMWAFVWDIAAVLGVPDKVVRAKAKKLIKRGLMEGCACGCRGDFVVPDTLCFYPRKFSPQ